MTLLERNLRQLETAGCTTALVLHPPGDALPDLAVPRPLRVEVSAAYVVFSTPDPLALLPGLKLATHDPLFFFDANLLIDARVLTMLKHQAPPCFMMSANGSPDHLIWRVGWFTPDDIATGKAVTQHAEKFLPTAIGSYDAEGEGGKPVYFQTVNKESDLLYGWRLLVDQVSQRPVDLVRKYVTPPIENWLVRRLCDTAVMPRHVTLLAVAIALAGTSLFYQGWFFLALAFAWGAILLQGSNGKLAQLKLMNAHAGQLDPVVNFVSENSWYWALGARLATTHDPTALSIGVSVTAYGICEKILRAFFTQLTGKELDEAGTFARRFCLIGGCGSIYLCILLASFVFDVPLVGLLTVLWWAGLTLAVRLGQVGYHLLQR